VETASDFPKKIYAAQKSSLKDGPRHLLSGALKVILGTFLNMVRDNVSFDEEFVELSSELVKYVKSTSAALESLDAEGTPEEIISPFSTLFLCTYRAIRIKSKHLADKWLRQTIRKHKKFLTSHGILDKLLSDADIAFL
jgi:hypothetical protein